MLERQEVPERPDNIDVMTRRDLHRLVHVVKESGVEAGHHAVGIELWRTPTITEEPPADHVHAVRLHLGEIGVDRRVIE